MNLSFDFFSFFMKMMNRVEKRRRKV